MPNNSMKPGTRILAMFIDHFVMTLIVVLLMGLGVLIFNKTAEGVYQEQINPAKSVITHLIALGIAIYLCKDSINGRSIAKRILNLQVIDDSTQKIATPFKYFVRNITCVIWPIEVIVALFNRDKRIGDLMAGTRLVHYNPEHKQSVPNYLQIITTLFMVYGFIILIVFFL